MTTLTGYATRTQSVLTKLPGGPFGYRHPRICSVGESAVGVWLVFLGVVLCWGGYWWGASLFVVAALPFWIAYSWQQSTRN